MAPAIQVSQLYYPESDGKPMGESDVHRREMVRHIELLEYFFRDQQVYVTGNILVYYEQGNVRKYVVPDTFVAKGLAPRTRRTFKIWAEGKVPDVVIETTSRKTRRKDATEKPELYARLGVKEYFLFDPDLEYLDPPLQGYRLDGTTYRIVAPDQTGSLVSHELGLRLSVGEGHLQFYRLDNGERLLTAAERARQEAERAEQADERAEQADERAEQEAKRAEQESEARREAEAEVARLRAELQRRGNDQ